MTYKLTSRGVAYHFDGRRILNGRPDLSVSGGFSSTWQNGIEGAGVQSWRRKIREGRSATSGLAAFETERVPVPIDLTMHLKGPKSNPAGSKDYYFFTYMDDQGIVTPTDPAVMNSLSPDIAAREQFISKYRAARTAFQSGVFFGELNQVVQMIRNPAAKLRQEVQLQRAVAKNARSRYRSPRAAIKAVKSSWLEFAFGVKPLVSDVQSALSLLDASPTKHRETIRGSNSTKGSSSPQRFSNLSPPGGMVWPYYDIVVGRDMEHSVRYLGAVDGVLEPPPSFAEQAGISWSNVLPTAYELIPYSFLIDYFSNLGKVIEGISTGRCSLAWGCRTVRKTCNARIYASAANAYMKGVLSNDYEWSASVNGGGKVGHQKTISREDIISVSVGLADFRMKIPAASSTKWLNIAALIAMKDADKMAFR